MTGFALCGILIILTAYSPLVRRKGDPVAVSLADKAYEVIKADIITCVLRPGQQIAQPRFAERYGMGLTPVREALQRLAQEGFVQAVPRFGYIISPIAISTSTRSTNSALLPNRRRHAWPPCEVPRGGPAAHRRASRLHLPLPRPPELHPLPDPQLRIPPRHRRGLWKQALGGPHRPPA